MRNKRIIKWAVAGCLCLATVFSSCRKDDDQTEVPNWETEFCNAYVNADAVIAKLTLDNGSIYDVSGQGVRLASGKGNITMRAVVRFARQAESLRMYQIEQAFSQMALPRDSFKTRPVDPVKVTSVWHAGKYLNIIVGEMTTDNGTHAYGFCIDTLVSRTLHVSMLHKQPANDAPSYTKRRYLSMPVATKHAASETIDSIAITLPDFEGKRQFVFAK